MSINSVSGIQRQRQAVQFRGTQDAQQSDGQKNGMNKAAIIGGSALAGGAAGGAVSYFTAPGSDKVAEQINNKALEGSKKLIEDTSIFEKLKDFTEKLTGNIERQEEKNVFKFTDGIKSALGDKTEAAEKLMNDTIGEGLLSKAGGTLELASKPTGEGAEKKLSEFTAEGAKKLDVIAEKVKVGAGRIALGVAAGLALCAGAAALFTRGKKAAEGEQQQ